MQKQSLLESGTTNAERPEQHAVFWWSVKVATGSVVLASLFIGYIYDLQPWFEPPRLLAQSVVIVGGFSAIYHYLKLKSINQNIEQPAFLETRAGLYQLVRHPMYLSDAVLYSGLFLLFPSIPTVFVLVMAYVALIRQAKVEDQYLSQRFENQFSQWKKQSKLFLPFVY